jgi:hypothetical protein
MSNVDEIAEFLALQYLRRSKSTAIVDRDELAMEKQSFLADARQHDALGYSVERGELVFTGKSILKRFRGHK